jgi:hypothetical protein
LGGLGLLVMVYFWEGVEYLGNELMIVMMTGADSEFRIIETSSVTEIINN